MITGLKRYLHATIGLIFVVAAVTFHGFAYGQSNPELGPATVYKPSCDYGGA
jgi:hypothetical protein